MIDLTKIQTERENPASRQFSSLSIRQAMTLMNEEDAHAVSCIPAAFDQIEEVIRHTSAALQRGGRLIYMGAGTSGRLGLLDAVECPPTFGVDYQMVHGLIAGGKDAFVKAREGAEDHPEEGREDLKAISFCDSDFLLGIAASGRTPYVLGGLEYANELGAKCGALVCTLHSPIAEICPLTIEAIPGPEVLTGSTRLKAGTVTKLILNMISTISMKEMGKIYRNYMVDLKLSNQKLQERGISIIQSVTSCEREVAEDKLRDSGGNVKIAIIMVLLGVSVEEARHSLAQAKGRIDSIKEEADG